MVCVYYTGVGRGAAASSRRWTLTEARSHTYVDEQVKGDEWNHGDALHANDAFAVMLSGDATVNRETKAI